jgi:hypothetical protein
MIRLIEELETGDMYKRELDTLAGLYAAQYRKASLQDSVVSVLRVSLRVAQDGWSSAEDIISLQKKEMDEMKYKHKRKLNIYKGIISGLSIALILL